MLACGDLFVPWYPFPCVEENSWPWLRYRNPGEHLNRIIVPSEDEWEKVHEDFEAAVGNVGVIGLDLEGVSLTNYRREMRRGNKQMTELPDIVHDNLESERPALLQMATLSGFAVIIQLAYFREIPKSLKVLLDDEGLIKVGVSIESDAHWFLERWGARIKGWVDLRNFCKEAEMKMPWELEFKGRMGLKQLAVAFFGDTRISLDEMKVLSYSNWARRSLSSEQLYYATFDAQVAVDICAVVAMKMISGLVISVDGRNIERHQKKFRSVLRRHLQSRFSRSELPFQNFKVNSVVSPNASTEKAVSLREYLFTVCEPLEDQFGQTEVGGLERSLRYLLKNEGGRLPNLVRSLCKCLTEKRSWDGSSNTTSEGYFSSVVAKLRSDRKNLLPTAIQGRYPSVLSIHVPKLSQKAEEGVLTMGRKVWRLTDPLHYGKMDWEWELERGRCVRIRKREQNCAAGSEKENDPIVSVPKQALTSEKFDQVASWLIDVKPYEIDENMDGVCQSGAEVQFDNGDILVDNTENYDDPSVDVFVSVSPCWMCGHSMVSDLGWEPIIPLSYVQLYVNAPSCTCNWAKLCHRCCRIWRLCQYETMLELGVCCQASLDVPKYTADSGANDARAAASRLIEIEKARLEGRYDVASRAQIGYFYRILKDYTGEAFVDPNRVLESVEEVWYRLNHEESWHEAKVVLQDAVDVVTLEKCFRAKFISLCSGSLLCHLPPCFTEVHSCLEGLQQTLPRMMTEAELSKVARSSEFFCDLDVAIGGSRKPNCSQPKVTNEFVHFHRPAKPLQSKNSAIEQVANGTDALETSRQQTVLNRKPLYQRKTESGKTALTRTRYSGNPAADSSKNNSVGVTFYLSDESLDKWDEQPFGKRNEFIVEDEPAKRFGNTAGLFQTGNGKQMPDSRSSVCNLRQPAAVEDSRSFAEIYSSRFFQNCAKSLEMPTNLRMQQYDRSVVGELWGAVPQKPVSFSPWQFLVSENTKVGLNENAANSGKMTKFSQEKEHSNYSPRKEIPQYKNFPVQYSNGPRSRHFVPFVPPRMLRLREQRQDPTILPGGSQGFANVTRNRENFYSRPTPVAFEESGSVQQRQSSAGLGMAGLFRERFPSNSGGYSREFQRNTTFH